MRTSLGTNREIAAECTEEPCGRAAYEGEDDSVTLDRWLRPDPCGTPEPNLCEARIRYEENRRQTSQERAGAPEGSEAGVGDGIGESGR